MSETAREAIDRAAQVAIDAIAAETQRELVANAIERGIRQQESGWDACETCLRRVADVVLAALEAAPPSERACATQGCARAAEFYWHDAGPFGAGTTWGCAEHVPDDDLGDVWLIEPVARAEQNGHGHTFGPGFSGPNDG